MFANIFGRNFFRAQPLDFSWWYGLPGVFKVMILVVAAFLGAMTVFSQFTIVCHFGQILMGIVGMWLWCWHKLFVGKDGKQSLAGRLFEAKKTDAVKNNPRNGTANLSSASANGAYVRESDEPSFLRLVIVSLFFITLTVVAAAAQWFNLRAGAGLMAEGMELVENFERMDVAWQILTVIALLLIEAAALSWFFSQVEKMKLGGGIFIAMFVVIIIIMIEVIGVLNRAQVATLGLPITIRKSVMLSYVIGLATCVGAPFLMGLTIHILRKKTGQWWQRRMDRLNDLLSNVSRKGIRAAGSGTMEIGSSIKTGILLVLKIVFFLIVAALFFVATLMLFAFGFAVLMKYILWIMAYALVLLFFLFLRLFCEWIFIKPSIPRVLMNTDKRVWREKAIWRYPTILIEEMESHLEYLKDRKGAKEG